MTDLPTIGIYTLSLHDALPIFRLPDGVAAPCPGTDGQPCGVDAVELPRDTGAELKYYDPHGRKGSSAAMRIGPLEMPVKQDRKSTRLNSSHSSISYAVFCLKKK